MTSPSPSGGTRLQLGPASNDEIKQRLDVWLTHKHPGLSRARWQDLIKAGHVTVGGAVRKATYSMTRGDLVSAFIPDPENVELVAEDIKLDILFEDADIIAINKPPGIVVHPAPGHATGTLVHALLHHCQDLAGVGGEKRPGIVHRLDQDTSGVLIAAKNDMAMMSLAAQFKNRATRKEYVAIVWGKPVPASAAIRTTIGRDPSNRKKMSTRSTRGRDAVSHYSVIQSWGEVSLLKIGIETGRTHQIRVHMAHIKCPVVGDNIYGRKRSPDLPAPVSRQLLHAWKLSFTHPRTGQVMTIEAPWPEDIKSLIGALDKSG